MSIVDDFRCKQDWGPDGYSFEVAEPDDFFQGQVFDFKCFVEAGDWVPKNLEAFDFDDEFSWPGGLEPPSDWESDKPQWDPKRYIKD